jgi:hypothetical protein
MIGGGGVGGGGGDHAIDPLSNRLA